jgi:hypothetical protein
VDELQPADLTVEKIAYSAFYMTRLEWVLRKCGIEKLIIGGIVTNGGVASTVRDSHVRDFATVVLSDGSAAFNTATHETAIARAEAGVPCRDHRRDDRRDRGRLSAAAFFANTSAGRARGRHPQDQSGGHGCPSSKQPSSKAMTPPPRRGC